MVSKKIALFSVLVLMAASGWAQYQGRIEGKVMDAAGNPLDGVEVSIVSSKLGSQKFDLKTGREGQFTQIGLSPGFYMVSFKKEGFAPRSIEVKVNIAEATAFEVKLEPAGAEAMRTMSESDKLFLQGNKLFAGNKFAEAAASYEEAIKLNQTQWAYYFNLGLAYKKMEKGEEARAAFARALELNPGSYSASKELAESLAKAGNYEEAKTLYRKALEISADDPDALYNLGLCQVSTGEGEAALDSFAKCIALKPDYADAYYQLGTLYIGQNKVKEAVESLEKFLALAPGHEKAGVAKQLLDYLKKQVEMSLARCVSLFHRDIDRLDRRVLRDLVEDVDDQRVVSGRQVALLSPLWLFTFLDPDRLFHRQRLADQGGVVRLRRPLDGGLLSLLDLEVDLDIVLLGLVGLGAEDEEKDVQVFARLEGLIDVRDNFEDGVGENALVEDRLLLHRIHLVHLLDKEYRGCVQRLSEHGRVGDGELMVGDPHLLKVEGGHGDGQEIVPERQRIADAVEVLFLRIKPGDRNLNAGRDKDFPEDLRLARFVQAVELEEDVEAGLQFLDSFLNRRLLRASPFGFGLGRSGRYLRKPEGRVLDVHQEDDLKVLSGRKIEALEDIDRDILSSLPGSQPFLDDRLHFLGDEYFFLLLSLFFFLVLVLLLGRNAQAGHQAEH